MLVSEGTIEDFGRFLHQDKDAMQKLIMKVLVLDSLYNHGTVKLEYTSRQYWQFLRPRQRVTGV